MKLHSEVSIGWIIVYASLLASLSGKPSTESNILEGDTSISRKDSISKKSIPNLRHINNVDATNKTIGINPSKKNSN